MKLLHRDWRPGVGEREKWLKYRYHYTGENQLRHWILSNLLLTQVGRRFCSWLRAGLGESHLPAHPGRRWSKGTMPARGAGAWQGGHSVLIYHFSRALNSSCFPSRHSVLLASSRGIITDPLDKGWEAEHGSPSLCPGVAKLIAVLSCLFGKAVTIAVAGKTFPIPKPAPTSPCGFSDHSPGLGH